MTNTTKTWTVDELVSFAQSLDESFHSDERDVSPFSGRKMAFDARKFARRKANNEGFST